MPKLSALSPRKVVRLLEQRGFRLDRTKGSHQIFIHPDTGRRAVVPFHKDDLPIGALRSILQQAGIDPAELTE
jgi:predicted RNA binding protein YcfA (HicA-like mRNA interferase family)